MTIHRFALAVLAAALPAAASVANADANWTGFYAGLQAGAANADTQLYGYRLYDDSWDYVEDPYRFDGAAGGVHLGYNHQFGSWVFGVEGDFEASDIAGYYKEEGDVSWSSVNWLGSLRVRAGYATGALLFYATGGVTAGDVDVNLLFDDFPVVLSRNDTEWGHTVGGGVEFAFTPTISGRIEYRHIAFDETPYTFDFFGTTYVFGFENEMDTVRIGASWRFDQ